MAVRLSADGMRRPGRAGQYSIANHPRQAVFFRLIVL